MFGVLLVLAMIFVNVRGVPEFFFYTTHVENQSIVGRHLVATRIFKPLRRLCIFCLDMCYLFSP